MNKRPIHALIVAAGHGSRFGADIPKQYLHIAGKTVLEHSVACLNTPKITDLTLVVAKDDALASSLSFDFNQPIYTTFGGAQRFLSVKAGVDSISGRVSSDAWVLIHDGARPCLPTNDLMRLIEAVHQLEKREDSAAKSTKMAGLVLGTPVVDTLKLCSADESSAVDGLIGRTIDRHQLWHAQTPQIFSTL